MSAAGWTIRFTGYLPIDERLEERLQRVVAHLDQVPDSAIRVDEANRVITIDWAQVRDYQEAARRTLRVVRAGRRVVVKPPWEDYAASADDLVLEIDPGPVFGSGLHETTALCLELLEQNVRSGTIGVDFGTGSGILAITAAKLGAARVLAVDADHEAAETAMANVQRNGVSGVVVVCQAMLPACADGCADMVVANITAPTIVSHKEVLARALAPAGTLIVSGMSKENAPEVEQALPTAGLRVVESRASGLWVALRAERRRSG